MHKPLQPAKMKKALIGYTGFVGSNILSKEKFDYLYNSKNIGDIQGRDFDLVVSAGTPAVKWIANKEPEKDMASIQKLLDNLRTIKTKKFVLISTVDVYPNSVDADEDTPIDSSKLQPYGKHRRMLEEFIQTNFDSTIIRLPALFGKGLKKNIIYDFLNNNCLGMIHQDGVFQFYNLQNIWEDIKKALRYNLKILNVATEPVSVKEVAREVFGIDFKNNIKGPGPMYDSHTKYAKAWNRSGDYLYSKTEILKDMKLFVRTEKSSKK